MISATRRDLQPDEFVGRATAEMDQAYDGYITTWFMWQLQGYAEAAKAFIGDNPEIPSNELYTDQVISITE
jgi:hypothetical protein